jgi:hypothetical protein
MPPRRRPRRLRAGRPPLSVQQILAWADHEHQRTGRWPRTTDGPVLADRNDRWRNIDAALRGGHRGCPGGYSLARLLADHRGVRNPMGLPDLTGPQVAAWAEAHHRRAGGWPHADSGPVLDAPGEKWDNIDQALRDGGRGLPGGDTLARRLARECGLRYPLGAPALSEGQIAAWAEAHRGRMGAWPVETSGAGLDTPGEVWRNLNRSLRDGERGLPGGDSLARLIARRFGVRNQSSVPRLTIKLILAWADAHRRRSGRWPRVASGPIADAPGETWLAVDTALRYGQRGLRIVTSLPRLLARYRGARNKAETPH